ncbi:MAG TPA: polyhydroxyalkanoic acid system family protein [Candidatus Binatia bacterium]|nr:polyhydroxyalkanoic acid system family protein [Candidatus Binatia bacterium]
MPLMTLSVQHGQTLDEARRRLDTAVHEITSRFGTLVRRVDWSTDRSQVRLEESGFWIELRVDGQAVHVSADLPVLGRLLGGSITTRLKEILQRTFRQQLPGGNKKA